MLNAFAVMGSAYAQNVLGRPNPTVGLVQNGAEEMCIRDRMKGGNYAFAGRKQKKRDYRRLWITRINAACRANGTSYSAFMNGLKKSGIELNRKMLSEMAIHDEKSFAALVETAKAAK